MKNSELKLNASLKNEIRNTGEMRRELEQSKFNLDVCKMELDQRTTELLEKNELLSKENLLLQQRVDENYTENMSKIESLHQEKLKSHRVNLELEEELEKLSVENENLKARIDFYKEKILKERNEREITPVKEKNLKRILRIKIGLEGELRKLKLEAKRVKIMLEQKNLVISKFMKINFETLRKKICDITKENEVLQKQVKMYRKSQKNICTAIKPLRKYSNKKPKEGERKEEGESTSKKRKFSKTEPLICLGVESVDQSLLDIKKQIENSEKDSNKHQEDRTFDEIMRDSHEFDFCLSASYTNHSMVFNSKPEHEVIQEESILIKQRIEKLKSSRKYEKNMIGVIEEDDKELEEASNKENSFGIRLNFDKFQSHGGIRRRNVSPLSVKDMNTRFSSRYSRECE